MTPSPLTHDRPRTNRSRRRSTGNARARARPPILSALTPQTSPRNATASPPIAVLTSRTIAPTASIQTHQASRRDQIPIVLAAPPSHAPPRFRALALFGRRPHQPRRARQPATENLHINGSRASALFLNLERDERRGR